MVLQQILHGVSVGLIISAGATSIGVIAATNAPQWHRIYRLALGNVEPVGSGARVIAPVSRPTAEIRL
jgi:hypothetical protein